MERDPDVKAHALNARLSLPAFPRSNTYDQRWAVENLMGPNVLWLTEYLSQGMWLEPGMRVLDMGCGKAVSSIFLAREFGVQVWAVDLWIDATQNRQRIEEAGVADRVFPIHAEAHALHFAHDFFDAAVSMDAYHYFGTDDLYLGYYSQFIKPDAQLGIVVPGVREELNGSVPEHLLPYWESDFCSFHSPEWWRTHWEKTGLVAVETSEMMPDGCTLWQLWEEVSYEITGKEGMRREAEMLRVDAGRMLGFTRLVARRKEMPTENL